MTLKNEWFTLWGCSDVREATGVNSAEVVELADTLA